MKTAWAVAAGALVEVPILALPAGEPMRPAVDASSQATGQRSAESRRKTAFEVVVHRGEGKSGTIRVGL